MSQTSDLLGRIQRDIESVFLGGPSVIEMALATFLSRGHLLIEGPPGSGKTSLAKEMARLLGGSFRRIQMTSDLMPSDIVGFLRINPSSKEFEFRRGPIFTQFLLADELNRTSPKTQSALLEAMAENTVTVDGTPHDLPKPFFVIATQNPNESQGVFPLVESQLDRFTSLLVVDYPQADAEKNIYLRGDSTSTGGDPISIDRALQMQEEAAKIHVDQSIVDYVTTLVRKTRELPGVLGGVSIRGGLQLLSGVRALALIRGRDFVVPKDVADMAVAVLAHRLSSGNAAHTYSQKREMIASILSDVQPPR